MRTELIRTEPAFAQLKEAWTRLSQETEHKYIYDTWEWTIANLQAFWGPTPDLFVIAVYEEEICIAIAPFARSIKKAGWRSVRELRPINALSAWSNSIYMDRRFNHHSLLKRIIEELDSRSQEWDCLELRGLNTGDNSMLLTWSLLDERFSTLTEPGEWNVYIRYNDSFKDKLSNKELRNMERRERKLLKELDARIVVGESFSEVLWQRCLELHERKWNESEVIKGPYGHFLGQLLPILDQTHDAEFSYIEINGRIEAINLVMKKENKAYGEIMNYSPEYAKWGIGAILIRNIVMHYRDQRLEELDLKQGNQSYKFNWTDNLRKNYTLYVSSNNSKRTYMSAYTWLKLTKRSFVKSVLLRGRRRKHAASSHSVGKRETQTMGG
ncbi:hypothetical protein PghCCS26_38270 [Paenibacillus glycanilyticus]|uniref:BioF2-like acetyltransferase domain-containing protein n=1 Tax=Paenibacillus glycanilyticus TaxID=126569 RepID=A0ABQ6NPI2_9BACL|nr:GNAT family N-acetyltransferase [Paenibacillus glycanilyticus]GMK46698.1 hypothetical protein PghCCS26_38270 [Paenibacillus glycanilyticus]